MAFSSPSLPATMNLNLKKMGHYFLQIMFLLMQSCFQNKKINSRKTTPCLTLLKFILHSTFLCDFKHFSKFNWTVWQYLCPLAPNWIMLGGLKVGRMWVTKREANVNNNSNSTNWNCFWSNVGQNLRWLAFMENCSLFFIRKMKHFFFFSPRAGLDLFRLFYFV